MCLAKTQNSATKWEERCYLDSTNKSISAPHWHFDSLCYLPLLLLLFLVQWSCHFMALFRQKSQWLSLLGKGIGPKRHPSWLKLIRTSSNGKLHPLYSSSLSSECGVKTIHLFPTKPLKAIISFLLFTWQLPFQGPQHMSLGDNTVQAQPVSFLNTSLKLIQWKESS